MDNSAFRARFDRREPMIGTFVKIPSLPVVEALADHAVDFLVLDQEHAPLDRSVTDLLLFAAKALDLPALVRVPQAEPSVILSVLDAGARGVLVPHVTDRAAAMRAAAACRYRSGRGYSGSARSARGGGDLLRTVATADRDVVVIAQIEDAEAIGQASAIAACEGVDGLFIGRADLAVSLAAESADAPEVWAAAEAIAEGARAGGKAVSAFAGSWPEVERLRAIGATMIIYGSDQSHLRNSARSMFEKFRGITEQ